MSFILFELFPLELCPSQKQLFMTILYQVMIVQLLTSLTDIFIRYELIVCMKLLEFPIEILFNVLFKLYLMTHAFDIKRGETSVFFVEKQFKYIL